MIGVFHSKERKQNDSIFVSRKISKSIGKGKEKMHFITKNGESTPYQTFKCDLTKSKRSTRVCFRLLQVRFHQKTINDQTCLKRH